MTDDSKPYAFVRCRGDMLTDNATPDYSCGQVPLTERQYLAQMERPNRLWECPRCGSTADFDDDAFERLHDVYGEPVAAGAQS